MCLPALASLGAVIGLGFLSPWEWVFINTVLPLLGVFVLVVNALGWLSHRQRTEILRAAVGARITASDKYEFSGGYP